MSTLSNDRRKKEEEEEREEESKREEERETELEIQSIIHSAERETSKREYLGGKLGKGVVLLSDEQLEDLLDKLSKDEFDKYVSIVADNELKGHCYKKKTHYTAILEMATKDRRLKNDKL